ncbi:FG-GAP repeat domain-containing protein [Amycolatopsis sp. cg5]|uniref:FG-GAP repeat domain-containing protein n=1 Tax=Amycolatopsis sp. cg5 TaxID=3238802 RepID=UPI003524FBED
MKTNPLLRAAGVLVSLALAGTVTMTGTASAEVPSAMAASISQLPCSPAGVTAADTALANQVHGQVSWVTAYNASCARAIVNQVKARGLNQRAAQIAITTAMDESTLHNYNQAVDADSLGLFQQRPSMGWGTPAQLVDPVYATNAFLNAMLNNYPNGSWGSGDIAAICQKIQKSGTPDGSNYRRYVDQAGVVAAAAWNSAGGGSAKDFNGNGLADIAALDPGDNLILFSGNGAGAVGWGGPMWPTGGQWAGYKQFTTGDFNGDGKSDVAAIDPGDNLIFFPGNGAGAVGWGGPMWPTGGQWAGYKKITSGDFNGDGRTDIAALDPGDNLILFPGNGAGAVTWGGPMWPTGGQWAGYKKITSGDFNGDGRSDIAALDPGDNLILFPGNGAGAVGWGGPMWPTGGQWAGYKQITAADYNGDGRSDIAALDPGDNLILFPGNGAGSVGWGGPMWPTGGQWAGYKAIS